MSMRCECDGCGTTLPKRTDYVVGIFTRDAGSGELVAEAGNIVVDLCPRCVDAVLGMFRSKVKGIGIPKEEAKRH